MAMNWREVKNEIEAEIDKIWFDEPLELTLSKRGIFPSGAGAHAQAAGNFVFLFADTHAIGGFVIEAPMYTFLSDPNFTLEHCKTIFTAINMNKCRIMGANHGPNSKCPAAWLNMPKFQKFYLDIEACLDTVKTKEELRSLLEQRLTGVLLIGEPDSGKTTLLRSIAQALAAQDKTVCVIDEGHFRKRPCPVRGGWTVLNGTLGRLSE